MDAVNRDDEAVCARALRDKLERLVILDLGQVVLEHRPSFHPSALHLDQKLR